MAFIFQGNFFGALATNQGSNSIDLNSASGVEAQQETFLRLTDEGNGPNLPPTTNTLTNDIFPATLVSSSMSFGDTSDRLPPGTAGFGTVEPVDLGSVNIQVQNQNLDVLPTYGANNVQAFNNNNGPTNFVSLPNDNLPTYGNSNVNQQNFANNNINQPNFANNNINQPNYGNNDNLPTYGNTNNNPFLQSTPNPNVFGQSTPAPVVYGQTTLTPNVFGQSTLTPNFGPSTPNSNAYQQQPSTAIPNELPNYGQDAFFGSPFRASSPITQSQQSNQQAWKGANQQQLLFQNQNLLPQLNSQTRFIKNERPVRFPGDASNRFDVSYEDVDNTYYDLPYEHYERESSPDYQQYYNNPSTPSPNIIAELAKYSKKNNLIYNNNRHQDPYIQYPQESGEADKELILYPSGQLILNQNNQYPTTIGPNLRQYLSSLSFQHQQKPPSYVFARRKPSYEMETELFDPLLEGDEIIERSDTGSDSELKSAQQKDDGILPILIRTAKDDLKLVGDVIKMAFTRRRR